MWILLSFIAMTIMGVAITVDTCETLNCHRKRKKQHQRYSPYFLNPIQRIVHD
jgi:hypothetical protein